MTSKKRLGIYDNKKLEKAVIAGATLCLLVICATFLYKFRHMFLCCHDSMHDFVESRMKGMHYMFMNNLNFVLARGRLGIIFPLVATFRDFVFSTGSFAALFALQYVPILINVFLIYYIVKRKTSSAFGIITALTFFCFVQVDIWHSLIDCYPLDFMYGLSLCFVAVILFDKYLEDDKAKKRKLIIALSVFLYYESLQVYEAFLTTLSIFAFLAFDYAMKSTKGEKIGIRIKSFVKNFAPHALTTGIYLGVYLALRIHPIIKCDVITSGNGTFNGFLSTWASFSTNMFPLKTVVMSRIWRGVGYASFASKVRLLIAFSAGVAGFLLAIAVYYKAQNLEKPSAKKITNNLIITGIIGLLLGLFFPMLHAMTEVYQGWFLVGKSLGYVPSTISYFGWALMVGSIIGIGLLYAGRSVKLVRIICAFICAFVFASGAFLTDCVNTYFLSINQGEALKAQTYYRMITSDEYASGKYTQLYVPGFIGIHYDFDVNADYTGYESGTRPTLYSNEDEFNEALKDKPNQNAAYYIFDFDSGLGMLIPVNGDEIIFFADDTGRYEISYTNIDNGSEISDVVFVDKNEPTSIAAESVSIDSIESEFLGG